MLRILIIDNTPEAIFRLEQQALAVLRDARVIAHTTRCEEGLRQIEDYRPDLVFLNITMMPEAYFMVLHNLQCPPYKLVYTAPDKSYALKALKNRAYDYLVMPLIAEDMEALGQRLQAEKIRGQCSLTSGGPASLRRLAIHTSANEVLFEHSDNIIHLQAESNYTRIRLADKRVFLVSKTLKYFEGLLCPSDTLFMRVHQSHIVNLHHIARYIRDEPGTIIMDDACMIPVSQARRNVFMNWLNAGRKVVNNGDDPGILTKTTNYQTIP